MTWATWYNSSGIVRRISVLHSAVIAQCDSTDGLKDGPIADPRVCHFDPAVLACEGIADNPSCLTPSRVGMVRKVYAGLRDPRTRTQI